MNAFKTILLFLLAAIFMVGITIVRKEYRTAVHKYKNQLVEYNQKQEKHRQDSIRLIQSVAAPRNAIAYQISSAAEAYQSASQGIEVQLKGLSWRGYFLGQHESVLQKMRTDFDAFYNHTVDKIKLDPDFPQSGYPDLIVDIKSSPSFYRPTLFSEYLGNIGLSEPRPYKSIELNSCDKRKAMMDLWLVTFDITFRIEPNFEHSRNTEIEFDGKHPVTRFRDDQIRRQREFNDMRYDRMAVFLEFKPKNFYYLETEDMVKPLNQSPKIGIGAVECIMIQKVGENGTNNNATRLGVEIEKGKSLPLYPDLKQLKEIYSYQNFIPELPEKGSNTTVNEMVSNYENIVDICKNEKVIADTNFFNRSKFSVIDLKNLGSWKQDKAWFLGPTEFKADYFHVKFLVHLYVLGEWVVKDENLARFEARPPAAITRPGVFDYLLPDFNLGFGGKVLSGIILPVLLILVLSFVFPPFRILVNQVLKRMISTK